MKKRTEGLSVPERVSACFDLPIETAVGITRVTIAGNHRVHVENHKGIAEYGDQHIVIHGSRQDIVICGRDLRLRSMSNYELVILGNVQTLELKPDGR